MSLVVWLPLNGNLENQGLSNVTITNNGATVDNNGKIGKCYSFGSAKRITVSQPTNLSTTAASLSCWVNLSAWGTSYDSLVNLSTGTGWYDTRLAFVRNNTANRIGFCIANGSTFNITVMTSDLPLNTWIHLAGTFDGSTIKIYVNGVLNNSAATTFNTLVYDSAVLNLGSWSNANNYPINGKLNDVRVYSHCLSAKEVKDLAKGLVFHYRLSGPGQENLAKDTYTWKDYTVDGSGQANVGTYSLNNGIYHITDNNSNTRFLYRKGELININGTSTYTLSIKYKMVSTSDQTFRWQIQGHNGGSYVTTIWSSSLATTEWIGKIGEWQTIKCSFNFNNASINGIRLFLQDGADYAAYTHEYYLKEFKMEKGSVATPWCPNPADSLYSTLGYNNSTEYDCSGYNRNGTKSGTITWDIDSPRYTTSYHFSNSQFISYTENLTFLTTGSISFWAKFNTKGSEGWLPFTGQNGSHYVMATSRGTGNFYNNGTPASGTIKYYEDSKIVSAPKNDGKWHHYVITGINMSAWTTFKINNYSPEWNSDVNYSDVRVYNTVLSAEDIAELYHSAVIVDNTGKSYAYEYFEVQ